MVDLDSLVWELRDCFGYEKVVLGDSDIIGVRGAKVQLVKLLPGTSVGRHYHKHTTELFYSLKGDGVIRINGEVCGSGYAWCHPGDWHSFENRASGDFVFLNAKWGETEDDTYW